MPWKPDDEALVKVWLAAIELRRAGELDFNLYSGKGGGTYPRNPRDFQIAVNEQNMDLMHHGSCLADPGRVLPLLASIRGVEPQALFKPSEIEAALNDLHRTDALSAQAVLHDRPILESFARATKTTGTRVAWSAFESLMALGAAALLTLISLSVIIRFDGYAQYLFAFFLICYLLFARSLIRNALNPARAFTFAEWAAAANPGAKPRLGVVFHIAIHVAFFFVIFLSLCASWEALMPGTFVNAGNATPHQWLIYGIDTIVRTVGLDMAEIFRLRISRIEHADSFLASLLVFSFRTLLSIFGVGLIVKAARQYRR
ncbi:MAG: hypothetical protein AB8F65_04735 [Woeseiaceae bacterium]